MEKITLTPLERSVLERSAKGVFDPDDAPIVEQDAEISLLQKAEKFEEENDLVDERIAFSEDCSLLKWFYHRYQMQEGKE